LCLQSSPIIGEPKCLTQHPCTFKIGTIGTNLSQSFKRESKMPKKDPVVLSYNDSIFV